MFDLSGQAALVTGASGGIGGAIARALHHQGAAEIVDHNLGAAARQSQRMRASKTIARAGHDGDASVKPDCHA